MSPREYILLLPSHLDQIQMHVYISHLARTSIVYFKDDALMGVFFIFIFFHSDHFSKVLMKVNALK